MTKFQVILISVFTFFILVGVGVFATYKGSGEKEVSLTLWGTFPEKVMRDFSNSDAIRGAGFRLNYVEENSETIENDLLEAIAAGNAPDMMIVPGDLLLSLENKLILVPEKTLSERTFKETFIEGAEIFYTKDGALGIPLAVDPLVMYWNRPLLQSAGFTKPPVFWQDFYILGPRLTQVDKNKNIIRSGVALGEYKNITHAKELLSTLIIQAGSPIVSVGEGGLVASLDIRVSENPTPPAESVLRFYSEFSDPSKNFYTWNKAMPNSREAFLQERLATYFGFGSELPYLSSKNPNLNFFVALLPQVNGARLNPEDGVARGTKETFGKIHAFVFPRNGKNIDSAISAALFLSGAIPSSSFTTLTSLTPARRDVLGVPPKDAYLSVFYESALVSHSWLDPSPQATDDLFRDLVSSVTSGRASLSGSVSQAQNDLAELLSRYSLGTGQ
ncbi:MAG: extracellular solute-binding protein [Patescibacteria group bacterium]